MIANIFVMARRPWCGATRVVAMKQKAFQAKLGQPRGMDSAPLRVQSAFARSWAPRKTSHLALIPFAS
jgi:hypothetical protein